jgi:hypothetical protein
MILPSLRHKFPARKQNRGGTESSKLSDGGVMILPLQLSTFNLQPSSIPIRAIRDIIHYPSSNLTLPRSHAPTLNALLTSKPRSPHHPLE